MRPKILICDNEAPLRDLVRATLGDELYDIVEARSGTEALDLAVREGPDLILLDVMMPGKSGLDVLRELRSDDALRRTPVIMLTARAYASDRAAAEQAGANRFLPKPFSPLELLAAVEQLVAAR